MILKFIYTLFIGILLTLFIGFGIAAFYEEPKYPEPSIRLKYPSAPYPENPDTRQTAEITREQIQQEKREKQYQEIMQTYNRNVSIIGLIAAIIYLIISLLLLKNLLIISDGLLLGGVFTLLYSIIRGFETHDSKFQFITVSIGLIIALFLGYIKFIKSIPEKKH